MSRKESLSFYSFKNTNKLIDVDTFHDIKLNRGKKGRHEHIGTIDEKYPHKINIRVYKKDLNEDNRSHCRWKFIALPNNFESIIGAQEFLLENFDRLNKELDIVKKYSPKDWVGYKGK